MEDIKSYRIRTEVKENDNKSFVLNVPLKQTFDTFNILSLKVNVTNQYKFHQSDYGIIVGRVVANGNFGIPNAKLSIFIKVEDNEDFKNRLIYNFTSLNDTDNDGIRYNTLPDFVDNNCHQDVGTFPNKRLVLDNNDVIDMFDKYWKYTTTTNESGDYMIYGVPVGNHELHVDIDLSDIGVLSQRPRDMIYKGYNVNLFDSANKFRKSKNLNSLSQVYTNNLGVYVYPYWGEMSEGNENISITRRDVFIDYKFEPTCIFIGSVITDTGNNAIGKNCTGTKNLGKMSELSTGEGTIEMIRKTLDNKVEKFQIKGDRLIDGDGVWCYQIPMNLDYIKTDEFGNIVPTDDPSKGIPTRTKVRFRISLDENPNDASARKRSKYLIPNNPRMSDEGFSKNLSPDYEFGTNTLDESYRDLLWNKVYTVKNYIPRIQKSDRPTNRKHTGIKFINHYGDNNPMPYNSMTVKLGFIYRILCAIIKLYINLISILNAILCGIGSVFCHLYSIKIFGFRPFWLLKYAIPKCISLGTEFCDDGVNPNIYYPGCKGCPWDKITKKKCQKEQSKKPVGEQKICTNKTSDGLYTCVETQLAESNDAVSCNFNNDWINGCLYMPLWYRKITPKRTFLFGLIRRKAKDQWCSDESYHATSQLFHPCSVDRNNQKENYKNFDGETVVPYNMSNGGCKSDCHRKTTSVYVNKGLMHKKNTIYNDSVYYYKPVEYSAGLISDKKNNENGNVILLFATDIVLLGSLNDCDINGMPQFFKSLVGSTFNIPQDILFTDHEIVNIFNSDGKLEKTNYVERSEMSGMDWGNENEFGKHDSGLFYSIGCSKVRMEQKSCINLERICEFGVSLDETKSVPDLKKLNNDNEDSYNEIVTDGFVSYDELYNFDERSMFATLNSNNLKTKINKENGLLEYDLKHLYIENFDGSLENNMKLKTQGYSDEINYKNNWKLENFSRDYYIFRMGNYPYYYSLTNNSKNNFPRYENSFYFYFGLKNGKTAIEKFNSQFFSNCEDESGSSFQVITFNKANTWCSEMSEDIHDRNGYISIDVTGLSIPYDIEIDSTTNMTLSWTKKNINDEKICLCSNENIEKKLNEDGYVKHGEMLLNDEYSLRIVDSDGNVSESIIKVKGEKLTFKNDVKKFLQPQNVLMHDFLEIDSSTGEKIVNYGKIANSKDGISWVENDFEREIGGTIKISDVFYNNKILDNNFKITIEPLDIPKEIGELTKYSPLVYQIIDGKEEYYGDGFLNKKNNNYAFGLPLGKIKYRITITQICNGFESNNRVTNIIFVDDPIPYKLYINNIDYDVIKNFNTGWEINGETDNPKIKVNKKLLRGWLDIENINNPYYNWSGNIIFSENYYDDLYDDEGNVILTKSQQVLAAKKDFINEMVKTFYLVSETDGNNIGISVRTDNLPYKSRIVYREEEASINSNNSNIGYDKNVLADSRSISDDTSYIDDIKIPTITSKYNMDYGSTVNDENYEINNVIVFSKDDKADMKDSDKYKNPYYVAVINNIGKAIPMDVQVTGNKTDGFYLGDKLNNYFGFHIIDKIFSGRFIKWGNIKDFPLHDTLNNKINNTNLGNKYPGELLNLPGLISGFIYNGSIVSTNEDNKIIFNDQSILDNNIELINAWNTTEQSIPTMRMIIGKNTGQYKDYRINDEINSGAYNYMQYCDVPNKNGNLSIIDKNDNIIDYSVYGKMKIILRDDSLNINEKDKKDYNKFLSVRAAGVPTNTLVHYYAFNTENIDYPLSKVYNEFDTNKNDKVWYYPFNYNTLEWKNGGDVFGWRITDDDFKNICTHQLDSDEWDSNDDKFRRRRGYGTTGEFKMPDNLAKKYLFVIAETEDGWRAISPIYDFSDIYCTIYTRAFTEIDKENTVSISINNGDNNKYPTPSYIKHYKCNVSISIRKSKDEEFINYYNNEGVDLSNGKLTSFYVPYDLYQKINEKVNYCIQNNIKGTDVNGYFKDFIRIYIYDCTGLKTIPIIIDCNRTINRL